jgi:protein-L-isoaspartate(D-aspartate) O-methyltransferase
MPASYKFIARRKKLVSLLQQKGITNPLVLNAIGSVPRELFMNSSLIELAYEDKAYPIAGGQTISQPYTVARQTELLDLKGGEKVLEIGTGSGYQSAVLCACGCHVYSVERQRVLYDQTSSLLKELKYDVMCIYGDGYEGCPQYAPYDRILVTAGCPELPVALLKQLSVGGLMVIPFGKDNELRMVCIRRTSENEYERADFGDCAFVPMLKGVQ